jgi:hypothetical protein
MPTNLEIIHYSANEQMTFADLKNSDFSKYDTDILNLQQIQDIFLQNNIHGFMM